jgi:hypothetical protein
MLATGYLRSVYLRCRPSKAMRVRVRVWHTVGGKNEKAMQKLITTKIS